MNIAIISGSPRKNSVTYRAALFLYNTLTQKTKYKINFIDVRQWPLPRLENVFTGVENTPDEFKALSELMFNADAFILVTPEYNGSYSSELKNLFDHFPKQMHKTFGLVAASNGKFGGLRSSQQLILLSAALFGIVCPNMLIIPGVDKVFNEKGELTDGIFQNNVNTFIHEFLWLSEAVYEKKNVTKTQQ